MYFVREQSCDAAHHGSRQLNILSLMISRATSQKIHDVLTTTLLSPDPATPLEILSRIVKRESDSSMDQHTSSRTPGERRKRRPHLSVARYNVKMIEKLRRALESDPSVDLVATLPADYVSRRTTIRRGEEDHKQSAQEPHTVETGTVGLRCSRVVIDVDF